MPFMMWSDSDFFLKANEKVGARGVVRVEPGIGFYIII